MNRRQQPVALSSFWVRRDTIAVLLITTALSGCIGGMPQANVKGTMIPNLYVYPQPICLFLCTMHSSVVREDVSSNGTAPITTGAKSTSSSTTTGGGN